MCLQGVGITTGIVHTGKRRDCVSTRSIRTRYENIVLKRVVTARNEVCLYTEVSFNKRKILIANEKNVGVVINCLVQT